MQINPKSVVLAVTLLMMSLLAGCMASTVQMPTRPITISVNDALDAQSAGMSALLSGQVEWTENQFSSLLSELVKQNSGPNMPIQEIDTWFEPNNQLFMRVLLQNNVLKQGNTLDLQGTVEVQNHHLVITLQQAGVGEMSVSNPILTSISTQINNVLASPNLGVAVKVTTDTGKLTVQLGS